jgi:hypothetical protein
MAYIFNNDHQPESVESEENFTDTREIHPVKQHSPDEPKREWRSVAIPAEMRGNIARRFAALAKKI